MQLKKFRPLTPSRRSYSVCDYSELSKERPVKSLTKGKKRSGGRNARGRETNINIGGGHKRLLRDIEFNRVSSAGSKVIGIEYDPNRSARIALVSHLDGSKGYVLAPVGLRVGDLVACGADVEIKVGNSLPLKNIPTGQTIHNIELKPGRGGQLCRSAGVSAVVVSKEGQYVQVRLPSGEVRRVLSACYASIGAVGNPEHQNVEIGKAGRSAWLGRRPHNRAVTKNPVDHPMGGGEGKTSGGRHPCSPTAVPAKGYKTRANKRTSKFITKTRSSGK